MSLYTFLPKKGKTVLLILTLTLLLGIKYSYAQQELTRIKDWNAYVHLPADYDAGNKKYPVILFIPAIEDCGNYPDRLLKYGPAYWVNQGHNMEFTVNGKTETPIVIALQPSSPWPVADLISEMLDSIKLRWRIDENRIGLTGPAMGGWAFDNYATKKVIYSMVPSGIAVISADPSHYPIENYKWYADAGGRWWGIENTSVPKGMKEINDVIAAVNPASAQYNSFSGSDCCWNTYYDPSYQPQGKNIYEWLLSQDLSVNRPKKNKAPKANAGGDINVVLPDNQATLKGSATDADGNIATIEWSIVSGPAGASIDKPGNLDITVTGLVEGLYILELKVTDALGEISTDQIKITVSAANNSGGAGDCGCDILLTPQVDGSIYLDLEKKGVKPGDKVCIKAGNYNTIKLFNVHGTAAKPITIVNCGGQVTVSSSAYGFAIENSTYFRFTGTGDANFKYGFKAYGTSSYWVSSGIGVTYLSENYEIDHVEVQHAGVGVYAKTNPTCDPNTWGENFTAHNIRLHDLYLHDIEGEGFYVGHSSNTANITCNGVTKTVVTQKMENVKIYNCTVDGAGWDGIQVSNIPVNCMIYNNVVKNYGTRNTQNQQAGLLFGGLCSGEVHDNYVDQGTGNGLQVFGVGHIFIYNNVISNSGYRNAGQKIDAVLIDDRPVAGYPSLYVDVMNNTVVNSAFQGIRIEGSYGTIVNLNRIYNNLIVNPGYKNSPYSYFSTRKEIPYLEQGNSYIDRLDDALFLDAAAHDYHLTSASPAVNVGVSVAPFGIFDDLEGNSRLIGSATDAGAYELNELVSSTNQAPAANAGADQTITLPVSSVAISASANDPDGDPLTYQWIQVQGPSTATITAGTTLKPTFSNLVEGKYRFQLTAKDDKNAAGSDEVTITVLPAATTPPDPSNTPPVAQAVDEKIVLLPKNNTVLYGSGSDADGSVVSYLWKKISGPSSFAIATPDADRTSVDQLVEGVYFFEFLVTDDKGATAADTVKVTVLPAATSNQPPHADAGLDMQIQLPATTTTIGGASEDPDGSIVSYQWKQLTGAAAQLQAADKASTDVSNLAAGIYTFELLVTDNDAATDRDTVTVTVLPAANQLPVVDAGKDIIITLPVNAVDLSATASDPDGSIVSVQWVKKSGPTTFTIESATAAATHVANLGQGVYVFAVTVTDNNGASSTDTVTVTVNVAANVPPNVNAGKDISVTLPTSTVQLSGIADDSDGSIDLIEWSQVSGPNSAKFSATSVTSPTVSGLIQGTYVFALKATDNSGAATTDQVKVTVLAPALNQLPTVNAGADKTITLPTNSVSVTATASDPDGTVNSILWSFVSGPATAQIVTSAQLTTKINNLKVGVYLVECKVTDNRGDIARDTMKITVNAAPANIAPTVYAGADRSIQLPLDSISLNGTASDGDGTIISTNWKLLSGPSGSVIRDAANAKTVFAGLKAGTYILLFSATDNSNTTSSDSLQLNVTAQPANQLPSVNAGKDISIVLPTSSVKLTATASDADGTIQDVIWKKVSGPSGESIVPTNTLSTTVSKLVKGVYVFECTVTDDRGGSASDQVQVTVSAPANKPPTVNAGADKTITLPASSVDVTATANDEDGSIQSIEWTKLSGPAGGTIGAKDKLATTFSALVAGTYTFEITVTDDQGATAKDQIKVTVNAVANQKPVVDAGTDQTVVLPVSSIDLAATASDPDGSIQSIEWTMVSGPNGATIVSKDKLESKVDGLKEGVYVFEITVTDDKGAAAKDQVTVTVEPAANKKPVVDAGTDQTIVLPVSSVDLAATANDPDGSIQSIEWTMVSGPAGASFSGQNSLATTVTGLLEGVYMFEIAVTDDKGAVAKDQVTVTVEAAANKKPVVDAGADQSITLPVSTVNLKATASDPDGTIDGISWKQVSGPVGASFSSQNSLATTITGLLEAVYVFEIAVTDDKGAVSKDQVQITVLPKPNQAPKVSTGEDIIIVLPVNTVSLSGSATDADGHIVSLKWEKISGPGNYSIITPAAATTKVTSLTVGVYRFRITATDNDGATAQDEIKVTVQSAAVSNIAPMANAGKDEVVILPQNSVTLKGHGFDPDGSIARYDWKIIQSNGNGMLTAATDSVTQLVSLTAGEYMVEFSVTDNKGAVGRDSVLISVLPSETDVKLYPNPAYQGTSLVTLKIEAMTKTSPSTIRVYDERGQLMYFEQFVRSQQVLVKQIDISKYIQGVYFIEVTTDINSKKTLKLIVVK